MPSHLVRTGRAALAQARNQLAAPAFARRATEPAGVPTGGVALFFATGPQNLYQFEQWRRPLEAFAGRHPAFVIVDRADTGERVRRTTALPVVFARGSASLERLIAERDVRVVLYCNQVEPNFRMLRFAAPLHIQIGHGESDKGGSVSNQHKAYDLTFVGGEAGRDRLGLALRGFDAERRTVLVGRPQLDHDYPGAPDWAPGSGRRVLYAPTWEGDRPSITYGSLASHGVALIEALRADADVRIVYRPHPRTGQVSSSYARADRTIRRLLAQDGERHLVDSGPSYGWQWNFADACITDVSAVAYDWLATGKPLLITQPVESRAEIAPSPLLATLPLLAAADAPRVVERLAAAEEEEPKALLAGLSRRYFGDTSAGASTQRFEVALTQACEAAGPIG